MAGFDFDFRRRTPDGPLGRAVASAWYARGTVPYRRERVAPTGSTVAVIVLGDPIIETASGPRAVPLCAERGFLIGPHDRPVTNEPTGETFAVGIVTTPVGCRAALGVSHGHLDREFTRIVGLAPRRLARLLRVERLLEAIDPDDDVSWADLAAHLGWADQSHMIRDSHLDRGVRVPRMAPVLAPGSGPSRKGRASTRAATPPTSLSLTAVHRYAR